MKVVIDTNVIISGLFFGGIPRKILSAAVNKRITACVTAEILNEYNEIIIEMQENRHREVDYRLVITIMAAFDYIVPVTRVSICRDPDDDKFISCAMDSEAVFIISGDRDLLDIEEYSGIKVMTAAEFYDEYLEDN